MSVKVIILTEGGTNIGIGHITRCISLCDAFAERGIFPELVIKGDASLAGALRWKPHRILNWHEERDALLDILESASIAIIDSYIATPAAYRLIADKVAVAAYIDDNNRMAYPRGHVINGSVYAEGLDYPRGVDIVYLLGSQYIPIRREFWKDSGKIIRERPERIMVTFGGDDSKRMTARILRYLCAEFPHLRKDVVVGKMAGYGEELSRLADKKTDIRYDLGADEMKETMMDADMAVSAGGQTLYELARIGVPSLGVCVADNQRRNLQEWQKLGFLENLGEYDDPSLFERLASSMAKLDAFEIRRKMSDCGKALVDGKGSTRVVKMLMSSLLKKAFSIRDAISKDASCIFQISNDDTVRSNSFHPEKITWDKHLEWFTKRLNDNNCEFFVAELNGEIYGQVRFDIDENKNEASVSISVKEDIRGLGMGVYMLDEAVDILNRKRRDIRLIKAYIKGENMRSAAVFEKAGFSYAGRTDINGQNAKIYTKEILSAEVQKT